MLGEVNTKIPMQFSVTIPFSFSQLPIFVRRLLREGPAAVIPRSIEARGVYYGFHGLRCPRSLLWIDWIPSMDCASLRGERRENRFCLFYSSSIFSLNVESVLLFFTRTPCLIDCTIKRTNHHPHFRQTCQTTLIPVLTAALGRLPLPPSKLPTACSISSRIILPMCHSLFWRLVSACRLFRRRCTMLPLQPS